MSSALSQAANQIVVVCGIILAATGSVQADLSAAEAWQGIVEHATDLGFQVSAEPVGMKGETLEVGKLLLQTPAFGGAIFIDLGQIGLQGRGDGKVDLIFPETTEIGVTLELGDQGKMSIPLRLDSKGQSIVLSGSASELTVDYAATTIVATVNRLPEVIFPGPTRISLSVDGADGTFRTERGEMRRLSGNLTAHAGKFNFVMDFQVLDSTLEYGADVAGLDMQFNLAVPQRVTFDNLDTALKDGLDLQYTNRAASFGLEMALQPGEGDAVPPIYTFGAKKSVVDAELSRHGRVYLREVSDATFVLNNSFGFDFPEPLPSFVDLGAASIRQEERLPTVPGAFDQAYSYSLDVSGIALSDRMWAAVDPAAVLPRSDGNISAKVSGLATPDDAFLSQLFNDPFLGFPGQFRTVSIDHLGASLFDTTIEASGGGDVVYGLRGGPAPVGRFEVKATGIAGFIDKLSQAGLLAPDRAESAKFLLLLYATPTGDQSLRSTIEFKPDGGISANGAPLR